MHLAGQPADLDPLLELGLPVVEDAAHAVETRYRGRKIGAISDATCFSLYATKNVAAGEGGLVATNRDDVAAAVDDLRVMRRGHGSLYDIAVPGYKANLSDVLAAIALVPARQARAARARSASGTSRSTTRPSPSSTGSSRSRATRATRTRSTSTSSAIDAERAGATRDEYQRRARRARTSARASTSCPCTGSRAYRDLDAAPRRCRSPSAPAPRCSRCRSRPRTRTTTSRDAIDALRRVHARFTA